MGAIIVILLFPVAIAVFLLFLPYFLRKPPAAAALAWFFVFRRQLGLIPPPAPSLPSGTFWNIPLLGQTLPFLKPHKSNSIGDFLDHQCSRYGRVFRSHLFGCPTIVSCDLELNMFILQNEERYFQSSYPRAVHDVLGKLSMMLVSGSLHKKLRGVAVGFVNASRPEFIRVVDQLSAKFVDSLKNKKQVFFFKKAKEMTFYLMLKVVVNVESEDPLAKEVLGDFLTFMKGFVSLPINIPGNAYSKAVKARKKISSTLQKLLEKRRQNAVKCATNLKGDFLDQLIENPSLNDDERVSVLLDILLAGYETTSGLMTLVIYFLSQSPLALQKLKEEHEVLRKSGEPFNWEAYKNMDFTSHVINEALRCGNLVKFVHRKAINDVKFKEYLIPEGWQVLPIIAATHLDPSIHENPFEFNPWRWEDPSTIKKVTPFGGGLRICPGAELGKLETAIFLHHFVPNFRWKIIGDDCPMLYPYMEFKGGLPLELHPVQY